MFHKKHLYLIGPGGVGKTTLGPIVANILRLSFIDLDQEFCRRLGNIGEYIRLYSYEKYITENSKLLSVLLTSQDDPAVIALSSGFLATDVLPEIVAQNRKLVKQTGTSVLLLPSSEPNKAAQMICSRQIQRGFGLNSDTERTKYLSRVEAYQHLADHQIISTQNPEKIAQEIKQLIAITIHTPISGPINNRVF
ncbi:MAG: shikimate kinase [Halopseudomonas aestusnigri]